MRAWLPAAIFGLVAASALVLVLSASREPSSEERADAIARGLRCPDCQSLSVADSPTSSAAEIRRQIDELISSGASSEEVRAHFVARYGDWILLAPASPIPWILPFAVVGTAGTLLLVWLARVRARGRSLSAPIPEDGLRRRLHDEAEALDA